MTWTSGSSSNPSYPKDVKAFSTMIVMILMVIGERADGVIGSPSFFQVHNESNRCGQVIGETHAPSLTVCASVCHQAEGCIGFNLKNSVDKDRRFCQITVSSDPCVSDQDFIYFIDPEEIVPPPIPQQCGTIPSGFALVGIELNPSDDAQLSNIYLRSVEFTAASSISINLNDDCPADSVLVEGRCALAGSLECRSVTGGTVSPCTLVVDIANNKAMCPKKMAVTKIEIKTQGNDKINSVTCCEVKQW